MMVHEVTLAESGIDMTYREVHGDGTSAAASSDPHSIRTWRLLPPRQSHHANALCIVVIN